MIPNLGNERQFHQPQQNFHTIAENERTHIVKTLTSTNWMIGGKRGAASILSVPPSTLRDRMKKLKNKQTEYTMSQRIQ